MSQSVAMQMLHVDLQCIYYTVKLTCRQESESEVMYSFHYEKTATNEVIQRKKLL